MNGTPMFNEQQFVDFFIKHCERTQPDFRFQAADPQDPLQFVMTHKESQGRAVLNLHNMWLDYTRTGDVNTIIDYLNHQLQAFEFVNQVNQPFKGVDLTKIYPVIRQHRFREDQSDGEHYLYDERVPRLDSLFIENRNGFFVFLTKAYIKPALVYKNEEEIKQHAYENLRNKGWNPKHFQMPAPSFHSRATIHVYGKTDYPFQHQFFLPDLARKHLPSSYLLAIPARDMAVALTMERPPLSAFSARKAAWTTGFCQFVDMCFHGEPRPISRNVYWMHDGRPFYVPGVPAKRAATLDKNA